LNAPCALWYSEEHACLSVMKISTLTWVLCSSLGLDVGACRFNERLTLNVLAGSVFETWFDLA
jgi:hypothetical protein